MLPEAVETGVAIEIPWLPQPRQLDLLTACGLAPVLFGEKPVKPLAHMIGYGGAAFGGKSDGLVGVAMLMCLAYPGCHVGVFRRTYPELEGADGLIERMHKVYGQLAKYNAKTHIWKFFNGSIIQLGHVQLERNKYAYQSQRWDALLIDEGTTFPWSIVDFLLTRVASTVQGSTPFVVITTNPGNIGHAWYKKIFVDGPADVPKQAELPSGAKETVIFLPARFTDNEIGMARDPDYLERLRRREPALAKALAEGDWSAFAGQAFPELSWEKHAYEDTPLPEHWPRWRSVDWGFVHDWVCLWFAQDPDTGRIYVYRCHIQDGLTDTQQARTILAMTPPNERADITYLPPEMWGSKTLEDYVSTAADTYAAHGIPVTKADNDRISGKRKIHQLLALLPDGKPGLMFARRACAPVIACLQSLALSERRPEDVQKTDGDDPYDALRYGLTNVQPLTLRRAGPYRAWRHSPSVLEGL